MVSLLIKNKNSDKNVNKGSFFFFYFNLMILLTFILINLKKKYGKQLYLISFKLGHNDSVERQLLIIKMNLIVVSSQLFFTFYIIFGIRSTFHPSI
jgi:hypothetical protein